MEEHFICVGECDGVAKSPGVCQAPDCSRYHEKLTACTCQDNKHNK